MEENNLEEDKHPNNLYGKSPKELADEFGKTSYFYQREFFRELGENVYPSQVIEDREVNKRKKLALGLEWLASETRKGSFMDAMDFVCNICNNYMKNPFVNSKENKETSKINNA
jgi:hypothetical protein